MIEVGLGHYLVLSSIIFAFGVAGIFINRKNLIFILAFRKILYHSVNQKIVDKYNFHIPENDFI